LIQLIQQHSVIHQIESLPEVEINDINLETSIKMLRDVVDQEQKICVYRAVMSEAMFCIMFTAA
jgi:hypothetical protein